MISHYNIIAIQSNSKYKQSQDSIMYIKANNSNSKSLPNCQALR